MKIYKFILTVLILTGCVSTETKIQNAQLFATELENKKDVLQVIEVYNNIFVSCFAKDGADNFYSLQKKCKYGYEYRDNPRLFCDEFAINALVEQDVKLGCLIENWTSKEYYDSDECIIHRRGANDSRIAYFDYKRFLPVNTKIHTDAEFLSLVEYYAKMSDCDKLENATTIEKQECKNNIAETTRQMVHTSVKCMNAYPKEYKEFLNDKGSWFDWAIDHDPYETKRMLYAYGATTAANILDPDPVYSKSEALKSITQSVAEWGQRHICDTTGWQAEIRKMGYKLN